MNSRCTQVLAFFNFLRHTTTAKIQSYAEYVNTSAISLWGGGLALLLSAAYPSVPLMKPLRLIQVTKLQLLSTYHVNGETVTNRKFQYIF